MRLAEKPFTLPIDLVKQIKFISPNIYEFNTIAEHLDCRQLFENNEKTVDELLNSNRNLLSEIKETSSEILKFVDNILLTLGPFGVLIMRKSSNQNLRIFDESSRYIEISENNYLQNHRFYEATKSKDAVNSSGAGDSFNVGFITALIHGYPEDICVSVGFECAKSSLKSLSAVPATYFDRNHRCWRDAAVFKSI